MSRLVTSARARAAVLILAGIAAGSLLSGPAVAHTRGNVTHLVNKHLVNFFYTESEADNRFINSSEKASDSNLLDGVDSTGFLSAAGKAADANLLDGINSTGFLPVAGKAADADKLDNIDSTAFLLGTSTLAGTASCPGSGFDPLSSTSAYTTVTGERIASVANTFRCAIDLPNGATVSGVSFTVNDPAGGGNVMACALTRTDLTIPLTIEDTVNTPPAATADAGPVTVIGAIIGANAVISNSGFGYSLSCDMGTDTGIFGAIVTYTVPASVG
ncbi:MAG: hypothetical protein ACRDH9_12485 [Actinomycetota bacterium]